MDVLVLGNNLIDRHRADFPVEKRKRSKAT
jgi:hypothetical protein